MNIKVEFGGTQHQWADTEIDIAPPILQVFTTNFGKGLPVRLSFM